MNLHSCKYMQWYYINHSQSILHVNMTIYITHTHKRSFTPPKNVRLNELSIYHIYCFRSTDLYGALFFKKKENKIYINHDK